jgi:fatty acid desaturase
MWVMTPSDPRLTAEPPLRDFTEEVRQARSITWYRTKLPPGELKRLHDRSDLLAAAQTLGFLAILGGFGVATWLSVGRLPWWGTVALLFGYGTVAHFLINGVHELGHGTVFRTGWLNSFFCHVLAFLGWINHEAFQASHVRHHRYTLHPPDDLEVVLPVKLMVRQYLRAAIFDWGHVRYMLMETIRLARGRFRGEWELTLFPPDQPEKSRAAIRWARLMLVGHGTILVVSLATGQWIVPIIVSLGPVFGGWLFWLCNNTQHVGLQDNVPDFRLCCRTFTLNPFVRFLYWQMNYHTEHHMYAAVPCYRLGRLHRLVRHDLPPTPHGIIAVWREITAILRRQARDPHYQHVPVLPATAGS